MKGLSRRLTSLCLLATYKNLKNSFSLWDAYLDVGSRWKNAPAFAAFSTSCTSAVTEKVGMRDLKSSSYSPNPSPLPEGEGIIRGSLMPVLKFEGQSALQVFIDSAHDVKLGLDDLLIGHSAEASNCQRVFTFDKKAAAFKYFPLLE